MIPTPKDIANDDAPGTIGPQIRLAFLDELHRRGYVITHPDLIPRHPDAVQMDPTWSVWAAGWNACRRHVLGRL